MTPTVDHNKLLTKIASAKFKPHGIKQRGKSRLFVYAPIPFITVK